MQVSLSRLRLHAKPERKSPFWERFTTEYDVVDTNPYELLLAVGQGHSFGPAMQGRRKQENFISGQHLGLDFDGVAPLEGLLEDVFIQSYAGLIYPTLSWSPTDPRYRVVFFLDAPICTARGYAYALNVLHRLFHQADPACNDISRMLFGNGRIDTEDLWERCYISEAVLPLHDLRLIAKRFLQRERKRQRYHPPVQRHDVPPIDEVFGWLKGIDPYAMPYEDWQRLGSAIGHTYGELAYSRFKQWSDSTALPGKYPLTWAKWKSLMSSHPQEAGIGTVFYLIEQYGRAA